MTKDLDRLLDIMLECAKLSIDDKKFKELQKESHIILSKIESQLEFKVKYEKSYLALKEKYPKLQDEFKELESKVSRLSDDNKALEEDKQKWLLLAKNRKIENQQLKEAIEKIKEFRRKILYADINDLEFINVPEELKAILESIGGKA